MNTLKIFRRHQTLLLLALILAVAVFFRFWQLESYPPGLYPDVAINGNDALTALKNHDFKLFYPENNGREGIFINLIAFSFWLFGASIWAIKIVPTIIGSLTVLGTYFLTKQLFAFWDRNKAELIALLTTFFIAISFWHVNFSRLGFRAIMVPFCLVWSFYFLFKGIYILTRRLGFERRPTPTGQGWRWWPGTKNLATLYFILGGAFFGLGFHTYIAFRIAPLILAPTMIAAFISFGLLLKKYLAKTGWFKAFIRSYFKDGWYSMDLFFVAMILVALPMGLYFWQHPGDFMGRTGQVSIFASQNPVKTLTISTIKTLGQFVVWGDGNWRHNIPGSPQIFWPLIPFFLVGLIFSIIQIFRFKNYKEKDWLRLQTFYTLLIWWGAMLLPSIMTNEGLPHSLRTIGAIPPSYIFTGLGVFLVIWYLQSVIKKPKILFTAYCLLLAIALTLVPVEFYRYFIYWGQNNETRGAFTQQFVDEARYLNSLPPGTQKWVFVNEGGVPVPYPDGLPMPAQTIIFLTNRTPNIHYFVEDVGSSFPKLNGPTVILPIKADDNLLLELKKDFPNGRIESVGDFSIFKLTK